ncbi:GLIPR1-like protein 1 [Lineus longissimus]|uniref:GLIPR1-like protein 1 n=1 Tax=Lineus longissimus TaxID=88925 RepID=UPI002B4F1EE2
MNIQVFLLLVVVVVGLAKAGKAVKATPAFDAVKFKKDMRKYHTRFRKGENAADMKRMKYDDSLASWAQKWTDRCEWTHGHVDGESEAMGTYVGQNMWMSTGTNPARVGKKAVTAWFNEKKNYDLSNDKCDPGTMCGHYTQIVWSKTTKVGCGYKLCRCETGKKGDFACLKESSKPYSWMFVVCDYSPGGNYAGVSPYTKKS